MITDADGIHARPATALIKAVTNSNSEVFAEAKGRTIKVKSILNMLSLGLEQGDTIKFIANGEDEAAVLSELQSVMEKGLGVVHE